MGKAAKPELDSAEQVMKPPRTRRKFRSSLFLINFVLIMIPLTYFGYQPLLRLSASIIIASDVPEKSDAILVLNGGEPARAWGAADLYNEKLAQYVIVTKELPSLGEEELRQRGIDVVGSYANSIRVLRGLGVPEEKIVIVETPADNTLSEMQRAHELCVARNWKSIIIVTANYHTRRSRLTARYVFEPGFQIFVVSTRHGGLDRNAWWKKHGDVRTFLIEFEKLVAYTFYIWPRMIRS